MGEISYLVVILIGLAVLVALAVVIGLQAALHGASEREINRTRSAPVRRCPRCGYPLPPTR